MQILFGAGETEFVVSDAAQAIGDGRPAVVDPRFDPVQLVTPPGAVLMQPDGARPADSQPLGVPASLFGAEQPVSGIAEAGQNVTHVV